MDQIEARGPVSGEYGADRTGARAWLADVVDVGAGKLPFTAPRFLGQGEHTHLMLARQPGEQRDQRRYDPILPGSVDASRHYQSDSHLAGAIPGRAVEVRNIRQARARIKRRPQLRERS
jgi:hypothetical protein